VAIVFHCECGKELLASSEESGCRTQCPRCQRELNVPRPKCPPEGVVTALHEFDSIAMSGKAIASLVLAVLSPVTCLLTGLPAILIGIRALDEIKSPKNRLTGRGLAIGGIVLGSVASLLAVAMVPALLTAIVQPGPAPRRAQFMNGLKAIALAMYQYESANGRFPPAAIFDRDGKSLLSWRVLILPYLEQDDLYSQFRLDEPWDSPHNKPLADRAPMMFRCPSDQIPAGLTTYQVVVDPHSMFTGLPAGVPRDTVTDGPANTLLVVEGTAPVTWTKPEDLSLSSSDPLFHMGSKHPGGFIAVVVDGSVQFIQNSINPRVLKGLVTRDGSEAVTIPR
jgi:Protein of unknown function (DUF1559)/Domain of unknown function (DUF4190)